MPDRGALGLAWRSLRVRTTVAAAAVTAVAVALAGWLLVRSVEDTQIGELRDRAEAQVAEVEARLEAGLAPQDAVDAAMAAGPPGFVEVVDEDGNTVAAGPTLTVDGQQAAIAIEGEAGTLVYRSSGSVPAVPPPGAAGEPSGDVVGTEPQSTRLLPPTVISTRRLERIHREVDTPTGRYSVVAAAPVDEVARSVDAVRRGLWVGLPALVALVALAAWRLVGRALRPVEAIRAQVDEISGTTIHRRVPEPGSGDEIGRLARTMNAMLGRLEAASTQQRRFVSDASHELRSPVAGIRADLEVALAEGGAADWPGVARAVLAEESRLEGLLADLLILASGDEEARPPAGGPVDLAAVAREVAERPRRVPVDLVPVGAGPLPVAGSGAELGRVVTNLVDNAARHARARVEVTVGRVPGPGEPTCWRLAVDDDGPGVPAGDRERVFERFTRLDDARARDAGGAGLGLAVVRSIVGRHRGAAWVEDGPLGGARFVVELPAAGRVPAPA
jgi:signal transduction histidine kinase